MKYIVLWLSCILVLACDGTREKTLKDKTTEELIWDFTNLNAWVDGSQNMEGQINYELKGDTLEIFTRANTYDRPKVRTKSKIYGTGKYTWRVYIPEMGIGDMASVGCFLYNDDKHELDFEIGYGKQKVREEIQAQANEVVAYITSQANPWHQKMVAIQVNKWYDFTMNLTLDQDMYRVTWAIDGETISSIKLQYGKEIPFYIFASVENLTFIGDHIPTQRNYALFDYIKYQPSN